MLDLIQDSGSYYMIEALRDVLTECPGDVIITHCNSGLLHSFVPRLFWGRVKEPGNKDSLLHYFIDSRVCVIYSAIGP